MSKSIFLKNPKIFFPTKILWLSSQPPVFFTIECPPWAVGLKTWLDLVPTCPKNRKNRGFLRSFDVWDSYDQCEHTISEIPDGRRFLRRDRKNRKHFYFQLSQTVPDVSDFHDEREHKICLYGTVGDDRGFLRWVWTWILLVLGHGGCLILSSLATKAWFSVNYECIKSTKKDSQTQELRRVRAVFVNFIAWKGLSIWRSLTWHWS